MLSLLKIITDIRMSIFLLFSTLLFVSCDNRKQSFPVDEDIFIQDVNLNYLSERREHDNVMLFNTKTKQEWETFRIQKNKDATISIKTSTGSYISYNNKDSILMGSSTKIGFTESFLIKPNKEYLTLTTIHGKNVIINQNSTLFISEKAPPSFFKIVGYKSITPSWLSLRKIKFSNFFIQLSILLSILYLFFRVFKNKARKNHFSFNTLIVIGFVFIYVIFNMKKWKNDDAISNDSIIYYEYLPAAFIFNDLSFEFTKELPPNFNGNIWIDYNKKTEKSAPKFTMGVSFMYLPFFLIGHASAHLLNYTTYGYSEPYFLFLYLSGFFYSFLGLFYLRKILLCYFNDTVTALTLFSIALATNLFFYTTHEPTMSHVSSFSLFSFFIWQTIKWHNNKKLKTALFIGLLIGLISLIRPTNALLAVVFILFNVTSLKSLKENLLLFWNYRKHILIMVGFSILVWLPQLFLWKYLTGNWLYFSYGEEGFFFKSPKVIEGLVSYRKGWLVYTPIMTFALIGLFFLFKQQKKWFIPLLVFVPFNIYIIYSWWCWWYGGSFGSRPMVDSYALLAIPLGAFYAYFDKKVNYLKSIPPIIILLATSFNLFQTQQTKTCLHYDSMTKEAYWANFTKLGWPNGHNDLIKSPDYKKALKGEDEH